MKVNYKDIEESTGNPFLNSLMSGYTAKPLRVSKCEVCGEYHDPS